MGVIFVANFFRKTPTGGIHLSHFTAHTRAKRVQSEGKDGQENQFMMLNLFLK